MPLEAVHMHVFIVTMTQLTIVTGKSVILML